METNGSRQVEFGYETAIIAYRKIKKKRRYVIDISVR